MRLQGVAILGERPLDQRLGLGARLVLLLEGVGLGVAGVDRVVLREDRRLLALLRVLLRLFLLFVGLGEFRVERLQGHGERHRPGRDRDPHQHHRRGQAGDAGVALAPPPDAFLGAYGAGEDRLAVEEPAEVLGHRPGVGESPGWVLLEGLEADRFEVLRCPGLEPCGRDRLLVPYQLQCLEWSGPLERRSADDHLVEDRPERVLVAQGTDLAGQAPRLLGGHVRGGPHDRAGASLLGVALHLLGESEVCDLGQAVGRQQDVRRLQVPVNDPSRVGFGHRAAQRHHHRCRHAWCLRPAVDELREAAPGDEFQGEVRQAVEIAVLVDLDDTRVLDPGDGARLDVEPGDLVVRGVGPGQDHLEGDEAIEPDVPGLVNDAHAAAADLGEDLVARDGDPDRPRPPDCGPGRPATDLGHGVVVGRVVRRICDGGLHPDLLLGAASPVRLLRASRSGHVERRGLAGRRHVEGPVQARRRARQRVGDDRESQARLQFQSRCGGWLVLADGRVRRVELDRLPPGPVGRDEVLVVRSGDVCIAHRAAPCRLRSRPRRRRDKNNLSDSRRFHPGGDLSIIGRTPYVRTGRQLGSVTLRAYRSSITAEA